MDTVEEQHEIEAEYVLESPIRCHSCREMIGSLHVVRMLRTRVNFTSVLPRRGCVMICPNCSTLLSANVSHKIGL